MGTGKIAVIGWDAATYDVVRPLLRAGVLPNLQRLMARGAWGQLRSTLHPLSPTAWASFMTGMNPGKHGVFDFVGLGEDKRFQLLNGGAVRARTLWGRLSEAGRRVVVVNVPMTYPPERVNGFVIAGMDAPRQDRAFTYPPELAGELCDRFGGYREGARTKGRFGTSVARFTERYVQELCDVTRLHGDVVCHLMDAGPVDFLMVVFTAPDRVQHALGHLMSGGISPDDGIGRVYRACDSALGPVLDRLGQDSITLLMSDHGASMYRRVFELSAWLERQGWLQVQKPSRVSQVVASLDPVWRRLSRLAGRPGGRNLRLETFLDRIVWQETQAFALGAFGSIYVNTRDRFPNGMVESEGERQAICERIAEGLIATRDPETGESVVHAVHRASDVYHGPYTHLAPDLLVETAEDYFVRSNLDQQEGRLTYAAGRYSGRSLAHTGKHTPDGILVAAGAPFATGGDRTGAHITDVAPTVLYLSGLAVPREMDGRPLLDWMNPEYCTSHPVREAAPESPAAKGQDGVPYSEEEATAVEDRLRKLGYLG